MNPLNTAVSAAPVKIPKTFSQMNPVEQGAYWAGFISEGVKEHGPGFAVGFLSEAAKEHGPEAMIIAAGLATQISALKQGTTAPQMVLKLIEAAIAKRGQAGAAFSGVLAGATLKRSPTRAAFAGELAGIVLIKKTKLAGPFAATMGGMLGLTSGARARATPNLPVGRGVFEVARFFADRLGAQAATA